MLSNWDTAKQYVKDYKDGLTVGSAEKENLQYLNSIQGKWNVISENLKGIGNTLITSDLAKGFLDGTIEITNGLNKFSKGFSNTLYSIGKGELGKSLSGKFFEMFEGFGKTGVGGIFKNIFGDSFGKITGTISDVLGGYVGKIGETALNMTGIGKMLTSAQKVISKINKGRELDNSIDSRKENILAAQEEINSLKNQKQAIENVADTYDKLSNKTKRSAEENKQLIDIRNQLGEAVPDMILGYDDKGNAILKNLKLQNKQLDSQIALKQQTQRLEQNALANDTLAQRVRDQKDFNKAYKDYNNMLNVTDTKRKDSLFGKESIQDYAKRIVEGNKTLADENAKAYQQRLDDHQKYIDDEKAIQQKYLNQMMRDKSLSDAVKGNLGTFMDALDWTNFSSAQGTQFTNQLSQLGEKLISTTDNMGTHAKAIKQLGEDYANGKINLTDYTKGLTEQYELAGKFDTESFSAWRQGLQSYVDTTNDLSGANKAINDMATSLNKITGISTDTWKTALSFDPAPIDASNKALQKFLNSYGTGVQNLGKGGNADKFTAQFQSLQASYEQMTSDLANGQELDVEYLVNATIGNPEAIQNLVKEITSDGEVTEEEMELLLNVQAELLNGGEITDETISKIAEEFDMTETEVRTMLNVKTEVKEEGEPLEEVKSKWNDFDLGEKVLSLVQKVTGGELVDKAKSAWDSLDISEKIQNLLQKVTGSELIQSAKSAWDGLSIGEKLQQLIQMVTGGDMLQSASQAFISLNVGQKIQELLQKVTGSGLIQSAKSAWESLGVGQKIQELLQKVTGGGLIQSAKSVWDGLSIDEKVQTLIQKVTGKGEIESAKSSIEALPKEKQVQVSIVQKAGNVLDSITSWFKSKAEQNVSVSVKVTGQDAINQVKSAIQSMSNKDINVNVNGSALSQVNNIKSALNGIQTKNISVNVTGNALSQVNDIKSALNGIQTKNISINASGNALGQINSIKSALNGMQSKSITITANASGIGAINALKSSIASLQGKSVSVTATASGVGSINALTSAISRVNSKSVSVKANVSGTGSVNGLVSAINRVKSKSVKVSASVSGTGAVQGLASAIAAVRSKSVSVSASVTKTVTTVQKTVAQSSTPTSVSALSNVPVYASTPMSTSPLSSIPVSVSEGSSTPLSNMPVSIRANNDFGGTIDKNKILPSLDFDISHIKDLEEALKRIGKQLDFLDEKSKAIFGNEKLSLLQQQIPLLKEQQKIQEQIAKNERAQNNELEYWLAQQGFNFDNLGSITNYNDKLLSMEKNVESLKKKYDDLNDVQGDKKNENAIKSAQKAYESANDTLSKTKKYLEEYFSTSNEELIEASKKWWEYENQITKVEESIRELLNLQLVNQIDSVSDSIDFLDSKIKALNGQDKIQYLQQQNELYKQQQQLLHELAEQMRSQLVTLNPLSEAYKELSSDIIDLSTQWWDLYGSIQDNNESIFEINKDKKTNGIKNDIDLLEDQIKFFDEKMEGYSGSIRIEYIEEQIKLYKEQQKQMHTLADELRNQLTLLDPMSDEYKEMQSEILKLSTDWWTVENSINDARDEIEELNREIELLSVDSKLKEIEVQFTRLEHELNLIDTKLEYAFGTDKIDLMTESIALMNKQLGMQQEKLGLTNQRFAIYQDDLRKYGFQFDKMGNMTNYSQMMDVYKNSDDLEKLLDLTKEYTDIQNDLRDLTEEYWDLSDAIKDTYDEQLEITKDVEDEITDIIKKEKERREKEIQDYTDERIKLLEKEKLFSVC